MRRGVIAEYADATALVGAIRAMRARGMTRLEAYTPYPAHEVDAALGAKRSPLAIAAGAGGLLGSIGAYALQWWLVARLYPVDAGGRPPHMPLAFVIISVEMGFLVGAAAVTLAFLVASRLITLWHPVFEVPGFESATRAGFWLAVGADDARWRGRDLVAALVEAGARRVHGFGGLG